MAYKIRVKSIEGDDSGLTCVIELSELTGKHQKVVGDIHINSEGVGLREYNTAAKTISPIDWDNFISALGKESTKKR